MRTADGTPDRFVFVSYRHGQDDAYVRALAAFLAVHDIPVWFDVEIVTGERWSRAIREKIDSCAALVVVMTPAAEESDWVEREVGHALALGKPILPLLRAGRQFFSLNNIQYEDVSAGQLPGPGFLTRLRTVLPPTAPTPAVPLPEGLSSASPRAVQPLSAPPSGGPPPSVPTRAGPPHEPPPASLAATPPAASPLSGQLPEARSSVSPPAGPTPAGPTSRAPRPAPRPSQPGASRSGRSQAAVAAGRTPRGPVVRAASQRSARRPIGVLAAVVVALVVVAGVVTAYSMIHFRPDGGAQPPASPSRPTAPVLRATLSTVGISTFDVSHDGALLATAGAHGPIELWNITDPARPRRLGTVPLPATLADYVEDVALSPDGAILAIDRHGEKLVLWSVRDPAHPHRLITLESEQSVARFSLTGPTMAVVDPDRGVQLWSIDDPAHPVRRSTFMPDADVYTAAFQPGGHLVLVSSLFGPVTLWDASSVTRPVRVATFPLPDDTAGARFSPDGKVVLIVADSTAQLFSVADPRHPKLLSTIETPDSVGIVGFDLGAGGHGLVIGVRGDLAYLYDITDPTRPRIPPAPVTGEVVGFTPDGATLVTTVSFDDAAVTRLYDVSYLSRPA